MAETLNTRRRDEAPMAAASDDEARIDAQLKETDRSIGELQKRRAELLRAKGATALRIVDFDGLPPSAEASVHVLDMTAGWGLLGFKTLKEVTALGYPAADYVGLYAVEDGEAQSMVRVLRIPFSTTEGRETVSAVQGVVTRRDRSRRGLARRLLGEVHHSEKAAGSRISLLWTGHC